MVGFPSLESICIQVVATHDFWIVQKRHIQYLPEHAANHLLQLLLHNGRLQQPKQLEIFKHSATALHINGRQHAMQWTGQHAAEWVAYIAGLSHLCDLSLRHLPKLRDKQLVPLTSLAGSLRTLDLQGCSSCSRAACQHVIGHLTSLRSLTLTDSAARPPFLDQLTRLTALTRLDCGGCEVSDAEITSHITSFKHLQQLVLWGAAAGDASLPALAQLSHLQQLDMSWSKLHSVIPTNSSLQCLDMSRCTLDVNWEDMTAAAIAAARAAAGGGTAGVLGLSGLKQLLLRHATASAATCDVLEQVLRSSSSTLQLVDITASALSDPLPILLALESASGLTALSLADTHLADDYCPTLVPCTRLRTLDLSQNPDVSGTGLGASLPALQLLQRLNLAGCTGVDDEVLPVLARLQQLQQLVLSGTAVTWEATAAAAESEDFCTHDYDTGSCYNTNGSGSSKHHRPLWPALQLLDLSNTHITHAGCVQLARQFGGQGQQLMLATATAAAGPGLQVLLIGSGRAKLGKQALAAIAQITTLQHLTLQRWQLVDSDLHVLRPLQQLQHLHVHQCDNWLLSDEALLFLCQGRKPALPDLLRLTRDGRVLMVEAASSNSWGSAASAVDSICNADIKQRYTDWLITSSSSERNGSPLQWPGNVIASITGGRHTSPTVAVAAGTGHMPAAAGVPSSSASRRSSGSARKSDASSATAYTRLSGYDERYRYTTHQLLGMRLGAVVPAVRCYYGEMGAQANAGEIAAGLQSNSGQQWTGAACIPEEIRADLLGIVRGGWRRA